MELQEQRLRKTELKQNTLLQKITCGTQGRGIATAREPAAAVF